MIDGVFGSELIGVCDEELSTVDKTASDEGASDPVVDTHWCTVSDWIADDASLIWLLFTNVKYYWGQLLAQRYTIHTCCLVSFIITSDHTHTLRSHMHIILNSLVWISKYPNHKYPNHRRWISHIFDTPTWYSTNILIIKITEKK